MTWNSNSRQSPLVLTDLQSVRWGPRDASVNVAVRNASRKLSWEELSKFTPNSPALGVKMRIICPSQLQPAVREAIRVPHDATAERHVRGIIALWFNFSRYYRQCVRVSGLERKWHQRGCAFFSAKEFERTHTEGPPPPFAWGIIRAMSDGILQLHPIAMKGPTFQFNSENTGETQRQGQFDVVNVPFKVDGWNFIQAFKRDHYFKK